MSHSLDTEMEGADSLQEDSVPSLPSDDPEESQGASQLQSLANPDHCSTDEQLKVKGVVTLVFAENDEQLSNDIMDEMKTITDTDVCLFNDEFAFGPNIVQRPEIICALSTVVFIVHTENTTKDLVTKYTQNETIAKLRIQEGKDDIRSLRTAEGLTPLTGLASMQSLDWYKSSKVKQLLGIIEYAKKMENDSIPSEMASLTLQTEKSGKEGRYKMTAEPRDEDAYTMTGVPKGVCVIINNTMFDDPSKNRFAAQEEDAELKELFEGFKFKVLCHPNSTKEEIMDIFKNISKDNCGSCFVCYLISHGRHNAILSKDCKSVNIEKIASFFRPSLCPALEGKPKCFFVDACRNNANIDMSVIDEDVSHTDEAVSKLTDLRKQAQSGRPVKEEEIPPPVSTERTPQQTPSKPESENLWTKDQVQDFFFGYATQSDDTSLRNNECGDIYTDEFIKAMKARAHKEDLVSIMTVVTRKVKKRTVYDNSGRKCWQLPEYHTHLNKKLFFK